ncbi:MAG: 50S ribosomal protein L32 [SAR202 cluster bacterium]|nr:50S ribosomal protein L32 [SAR202 cluster bacterium]|tara:strand:+ start:1089 stop:1325 length:237 start_codon:yes stop_codon:yes gene_type:complete
MPPLPKKKHTRARKGNRNAHNAMKLPALSMCGGCGEVAQPHITCPECGNYKGRTMPGNWDRVNQLEQVQPVAADTNEK